MSSSQNDFTLTFVSATAGVRYWALPILWVQGGLGVGHAVGRYDGILGTAETRSDDIPVVQLAIGVELIRGERWALDLEAKVAQGSSTDDDNDQESTGRMAGIGVGVTFF